MIIDTHCHLLSTEYEDVDLEIKKAFTYANKIIINGYDVESSVEAVELSKKYDDVYAAVGIGPENVQNITQEDINKIKDLSKNKKVVAIGEIGLDYYWTKETKKEENYVFEEMLKIAEEKKLPVIVHNRNATDDILTKLKAYNVTGIVHCFSGSLETANEFIKLGFLLGIGGVITFKNAVKLKEVVKNVPLSNLCLETDSPFLTPEPYRGKQNNPMYIKYILEKIADITGENTSNVVDIITKSVLSKFDL